ncbi:MAG: hypothetical protein JOY60_05165 [Burkholderiaceae bacterium]|nr:hypothetical protein [Roseateles sp.]MBV8469235.1 hypothetical protein [Burkholderiaceae bacterium]
MRKPARYLVVIDSGGYMVARLFLDNGEQVAELDASTEEVTQMTIGLTAAKSATDPAWDRALQGHSAVERAGADVYTLGL